MVLGQVFFLRELMTTGKVTYQLYPVTPEAYLLRIRLPGGWHVDAHVNMWGGSTDSVSCMLAADEDRGVVRGSLLVSTDPEAIQSAMYQIARHFQTTQDDMMKLVIACARDATFLTKTKQDTHNRLTAANFHAEMDAFRLDASNAAAGADPGILDTLHADVIVSSLTNLGFVAYMANQGTNRILKGYTRILESIAGKQALSDARILCDAVLCGETKEPRRFARAFARAAIHTLTGLLGDIHPADVLLSVRDTRHNPPRNVDEMQLRDFANMFMNTPTTRWHELAKRDDSPIMLALFTRYDAVEFRAVKGVLCRLLGAEYCTEAGWKELVTDVGVTDNLTSAMIETSEKARPLDAELADFFTVHILNNNTDDAITRASVGRP